MAKKGKKSGIKLSKSWGVFDRELRPSTQKRNMAKSVKKATKRVGIFAAQEMRQTIQGGSYVKNANLTIALKHSSQPLIDTGNMRDSVTSRTINDFSTFVGILKSDQSYKNAVTVHGYNSRGATIKVTDPMRRLFSVLADAYQGNIRPNELKGRAAELWKKYQGPWYALSPATTQIRIPPRPFVKQTIAKKAFRNRVKQIWSAAINESYRLTTKRVNRANNIKGKK